MASLHHMNTPWNSHGRIRFSKLTFPLNNLHMRIDWPHKHGQTKYSKISARPGDGLMARF
jgi:hypothetical protein